MKRKLTALFGLAVLLLMLVLPVYATNTPDTETEPPEPVIILRVDFPHIGTQFSLHRVATLDSEGNCVPSGDFGSCPVDWENVLDNPSEYAAMLESYVHLWALDPLVTSGVGWGGSAYFQDVETGLYLITSGRITTQGSTYCAQPLLVPFVVPNDTQVYELVVSPKSIVVPPYSDETITQKVIKVWDDPDSGEKHPDSVTVYLICDGELYDTQVLSKTNNWVYSWDNLEINHSWSVAEEPVENYAMSVEKTGNTFVITNTRTEEDEPPTTPSTSTTPTDDTTPTTPTETKPSDSTSKLPQTGVLWWPVILFAAAGMIIFLTGWIISRGEKPDV